MSKRQYANTISGHGRGELMNYERRQIERTASPVSGEYRLKITGDSGETTWLSITEAQRDAIADVLDPVTVSSERWEKRARYLERAIDDIAVAVGLDTATGTTHQVIMVVRNLASAVSELYPQGTRVELVPHTDAWMRGDRYGTVVTVGLGGLRRVLMDRSGKAIRLSVGHIRRALPDDDTKGTGE